MFSKETFIRAVIKLHHLIEIQNVCRVKGKMCSNVKVSQIINYLSPNLS